MALQLIDHGSAQYQQMVDLRYQLLRKPLGMQFSPEELEHEKTDILMGCFDDGVLEACCLLTEMDKETVRLRQMAVLKGLQGKGIGRVLLQFAENVARDRGYHYLKMHARKTALGFYEKLGYKVAGTEFLELGIPHLLMEKKL